MIMEFDGKLELTINGRNTPDLRFPKNMNSYFSYSEGAKSSKSDKEAVLL